MTQLDKYEYNLKLDEIKTLLAEGKYRDAADIADTINWNKVKNVNALVKAGEVYEKVGRYDESRDILLNAYDRSPIGRTIIYRLAEVAIKMNDFEGAKEYYDEFIDIAPHDNQKYVLKYSIKKAQGADILELIPILEEFKEEEYTEEWAYELAYLYHKAQMVEKCVDACDELILWFGDGPYVESALELKMLYQPLTKTQEEKYRLFREEKEGKTIIDSETMERAGELVRDPIAIPQVTLSPSRFNTTNLQEEIVKGMQQIIEATEKETVVGTMDSIKKIAEEIPYLQLPTEEELAAKEAELNIETDEEIDGSLRINFQELLGEESDGQISLVMKERAQLEKQITGQMSIEDVLIEWERTKRAAEAALYEAEQRKLESAKARALQEAEDIMIRLNDIIPKLAAAEVRCNIPQTESLDLMTGQDMENVQVENNGIPEMSDVQERALFGQITMRMPELTIEEAPIDEVMYSTPNNFIYKKISETEESVFEEDALPEIEAPVFEEDALPEIEEPVFEEDALPEIEEPVFEEDALPEIEEPVFEEDALPEIEEPAFVEDSSSVAKKTKIQIVNLTEEQKAIFSYFMPIKGMETQLCKVLSEIINNLNGVSTASTGNLIIQGSQGCGKTVLATSIVKVLQKQCGKPNGKIGKIEADALNKKDIQRLLRKVTGGCLIIERASALSRQTVVTLSLLLEQDSNGTLIILEDTEAGIKKALMIDDGFAKKFTQSITVPIFSNDDLIVFAKSYANELGYFIDEMAILALHNRISNIQRIDQATTLVEVKDIIDDAIEREARGGIRKAFNILTAKRYTDDDKIVLTEKDFE